MPKPLQEVLSFKLQPGNIAAHVGALSQLTSTTPAKRKAGQALLSACQNVLDAFVKGASRDDEKIIAALYTVSKVKTSPVHFIVEAVCCTEYECAVMQKSSFIWSLDCKGHWT